MTDFSTNVIDTTNRKYWFIRTDGGENFESFYNNSFVAIGWNKVTLRMLKQTPIHQVRSLIEQEYVKPVTLNKRKIELEDYDPESSGVKAAITGIINKIVALEGLTSGDIIIIPSESSHELAFGIIQDDHIYEEVDDKCEYLKRRKVKWIKRLYSWNLDAKFAYIRTTAHAISEINKDYYDIIDATMFNSFVRDGFSNISLKIQYTDDIDYGSLKDLIDGLVEIAKAYNSVHGVSNSNEDAEKVFIKLNLQSPGFFNLKEAGVGLLFALSVLATSCNQGESAAKQTLKDGGLENQIGNDTIQKLNTSREALNVEFEAFDSLSNNN